MKILNKHSRRFAGFGIALGLGLVMMGATTPARAQSYQYNVSIPTDILNTAGNSPYSLDFQLTDGSGLGDANNTVTITGFNVGVPDQSLTDNAFFTDDTVSFTPNPSPGSTLNFLVTTTNNADTEPGASPDEFSFYINDNTSLPTSTTDPTFANSLFTIDLGGTSPVVTVYNGAGAYAGLNPQVNLVPESSSLVCLSLGGLLVGGLIFGSRRRRNARTA